MFLYVTHVTVLWPSGPTGTFENSVPLTKPRAQPNARRDAPGELTEAALGGLQRVRVHTSLSAHHGGGTVPC